ncbi:ATP-binding cassette domain-containing protein [Brumimicrobium glaciale]|uniref:ATP-binding cassette domain-containing protein n=1 Tax=Brumimicrobium glaciale TaxID=200475 RepID=A0A4Q4KNW4_9FLAO|nr:ATP-binding cassette domain-containing protein [Brumimicrobium glaciale]RYM35115.1 ATP-binding cassette domain-containing protein [Brumimicrobium glaciale]
MEERLSITKRFWQLIKVDGKEIRNVYYYSFFAGLTSLTLPLGIQSIINLIQIGRINSAWIVMVIIVVLGFAVKGILQILQLRITENIQQRIFTRAAFEFAYRIPRIRLEALFKTYTPELVNRFFDVMTIQKGMSKLLTSISTAGITVFLGLILLSLYHPFFIIFSFLLLAILYFMFQFMGRRGLNTSLEESTHKYKLAHWLEEVGRTSISFKLAGKTDYALERSNIHAEDYLNAREKHFKVLVSQYSLLVIFKVLIVAGLLIIGGVLVMEQQMNIGQFVAAEIIIVMIINSVEKLIRDIDTIYDVLTGIEKVAQVTDMPLENDDGFDLRENLPQGGLNVNINNLTFTYPNNSISTLIDVDFKVKSNEKIALVGGISSGKGTILQLIAGLYEVDHGNISFNDLSIGSLNLESLRSVMGSYLQQEDLFYGTIIENIMVGRKSATPKNVRWAIEKVGLTQFIGKLPLGYNTMILPNGKTLPKDVIQKLLIARSIVDKPRLLLFENSFVQLNEIDKDNIIKFLFDKSNQWTIIFITNDEELMQSCDKVVVMDSGRIKGQGKYEQIKSYLNNN